MVKITKKTPNYPSKYPTRLLRAQSIYVVGSQPIHGLFAEPAQHLFLSSKSIMKEYFVELNRYFKDSSDYTFLCNV